jgi:ABC-type nitrate/sulfonate/bicarbonate transport system substrate-binding protein
MGKTPANSVVITPALSALLVPLLLLIGCGGSKTATVRIGYLSNTGSLPLFVAEEKGFFTEEGIHEEATPIATSNQLVDALAAGNLDAYPESSAYPVLAVELQSPGRLKIFSASEITKQKPFDSILVKDSSPIGTLPDLAGKRIGVFPGSTATSLLRKYLKDSHIDVSGIVFVPIPPQTQLGALLEGSIDALHAYEPTTAIALARGGVREIVGDAVRHAPRQAVVGARRIAEAPSRDAGDRAGVAPRGRGSGAAGGSNGRGRNAGLAATARCEQRSGARRHDQSIAPGRAGVDRAAGG